MTTVETKEERKARHAAIIEMVEIAKRAGAYQRRVKMAARIGSHPDAWYVGFLTRVTYDLPRAILWQCIVPLLCLVGFALAMDGIIALWHKLFG